MALEEVTGRHFTMWWPRNFEVGASFDELFANDWDVVEAALDETMLLRRVGNYFDATIDDVVTSTEPDIRLRTAGWLVQPVLYRGHARLMERAAELFLDLCPIPEIADRIAAFRRENFRPTMIGVHLRRGDMTRHRPDLVANTDRALTQVERYLRQAPDAGILLCTDDGAIDAAPLLPTPYEGLKEIFRQRFGERVVWTTQRSSDRNTAVAIQDAVVDLMLLREVDYLVGTEDSSFSEMGVFGRKVPYVLYGSGLLPRDWKLRLLRYSGVEFLIIAAGLVRNRRRIPLVYLLSHYKTRRRQLLIDLLCVPLLALRLSTWRMLFRWLSKRLHRRTT
jgi:hypothetical protein